jgi:hypothetical protein
MENDKDVALLGNPASGHFGNKSTPSVEWFAQLSIGDEFTAAAYGATLFVKTDWHYATVVDSYSPEYPEGQMRRIGARLKVRQAPR